MYNPYQMYSPQPQMMAQQAYNQQNANPNIQMQNMNQNMQIQSGGFVPIRDENMAYSYPVEYGKCVTFKVEGKPIVIEKSMGFSQLEAPTIKRYRLVEEDIVEEKQQNTDDKNPLESKFESLSNRIDSLESEISMLKSKPRQQYKKREDVKDDSE